MLWSGGSNLSHIRDSSRGSRSIELTRTSHLVVRQDRVLMFCHRGLNVIFAYIRGMVYLKMLLLLHCLQCAAHVKHM